MTSDTPDSLLTYSQLQNTLRTEFARSRRYSYPIACLALQVDRLENLRDIHGVAAKSRVLATVAALVRAQTRMSDSVGLNGDRIIVVLPHTPSEETRAVAERLVRMAAKLVIPFEGQQHRVTLSAGAATSFDKDSIFFDSVLKSAESILATVVGSGGNGVQTDQDTLPAQPVEYSPEPRPERPVRP